MQFDAARIASNRREFFIFICFPLSISSVKITQNLKANMSWERYDFRMGIIFKIISFFLCRRSFEATTRRRRLLRSSLCSSSYLQTFVMNIFRYFHRIFLYIFKHFTEYFHSLLFLPNADIGFEYFPYYVHNIPLCSSLYLQMFHFV